MYRSNCLCCLELDNETIGDVAAAPIVELINEFAATVLWSADITKPGTVQQLFRSKQRFRLCTANILIS